MKKIILSLALVGGMFATSDLNAFTAVTSGAWSNAATWGGIGPGTTVSNQDIIIPSGITVDLDQDVTFSGLLNSFFVTGTLMNSVDHRLYMGDGTLTGSGQVFIHRIDFMGATSVYSFTGTIAADVIRNNGTVVNVASTVVVNDSLDLAAGGIVLNSGGNLQLMGGTQVVINAGLLTNNGGMLTTGQPYDVWYIGITKITGEELNSASLRHVYLALNSNTEDVILSSHMHVMGDLSMIVGHLSINGYRLRLNGDLIANSGTMFESSGASDIEVRGASAMTDGLTFSAGSTLDELTISRDTHSVYLLSDVTITGRLELEEGTFRVDNSSNLAMAAGSTIARFNGVLWIDPSATVDLSQPYNVEYLGEGTTTGVELSGTGVTNVLIDLFLPQDIITLTQDLTVPGNFNLYDGQFDLDTFDIRFDGTFDQTSTAEIWGSLNSRMVMSMSTSVNDTLWMRLQAYPLDEMVIDIPAGSTLTLGANLFLTRLVFISGKLDVANSVMKMGSAFPQIVGYTDQSYIVTGGYGYVWMYVMANDPNYAVVPVGTSTEFSPVWLRQTGVGTSGDIAVRVKDGVWTNGGAGTDVSATQNVVNKSWYLIADTNMVVNMDFRAGWSLTSEVNSFDRSQCFVKNYYNNLWDSYPASAAQTGPSNTHTVERLGLQNDGWFTVVDNSSPLTVPEIPVTTVNVYPNPTTDYVFTEVPVNSADMYVYEVFDATGRLVSSFSNAEARNQIDFRTYELGSYTMRITNVTTNEVITRLIIKS